MERIDSISATIFINTSAFSAVNQVFPRCLKRLSIRSKSSTSALWLSLTSFAACAISIFIGSAGKKTDERTTRRTPTPTKATFAEEGAYATMPV
jgi:hypothetical protein